MFGGLTFGAGVICGPTICGVVIGDALVTVNGADVLSNGPRVEGATPSEGSAVPVSTDVDAGVAGTGELPEPMRFKSARSTCVVSEPVDSFSPEAGPSARTSNGCASPQSKKGTVAETTSRTVMAVAGDTSVSEATAVFDDEDRAVSRSSATAKGARPFFPAHNAGLRRPQCAALQKRKFATRIGRRPEQQPVQLRDVKNLSLRNAGGSVRQQHGPVRGEFDNCHMQDQTVEEGFDGDLCRLAILRDIHHGSVPRRRELQCREVGGRHPLAEAHRRVALQHDTGRRQRRDRHGQIMWGIASTSRRCVIEGSDVTVFAEQNRILDQHNATHL